MTPQCKATTKSGKRCRGRAQAGTDYCGPHQPASRKASLFQPAREFQLDKVGRRALRRSLRSPGSDTSGQRVYVIESAEGVRGVKIGVARNPKSRLRDLQVARPDLLRVAGVVVPSAGTALAVEQAAHAVAARYRLQGEWFDLSAEAALEAVRMADAAIAAGGSPHQVAERLGARPLVPEHLRSAADRVNASRHKPPAPLR